MANIMSLKSLRNKTSRNGFDLSFKKNFTAKAGELLPVMVKEVLPGDSFKINLKSFTRTQPVNTAAFARMREYYDFYFVPYDLLWNKAGTALTQMYDNPQHAVSLDPTKNFVLNGDMPYCTTEAISLYLSSLLRKPTNLFPVNNYFGYSRAFCSAKLLEYLGYGNFYTYVNGEAPDWQDAPRVANLELNLFGLLAYQKIYADYYRDSQWERISPSTFNVDYLSGDNMKVDFSSDVFMQNYNFFDLRYCNWQKDLFHGVLPRQQYGDVATVAYPSAVSELGAATLVDGSIRTFQGDQDPTFESATVRNIKLTDPVSISAFSILALRQAEFLQKWKEITQSGNKDYKDQIEKHWGVSAGDALSEMCTYLGGISSSLDINEVVNTNITGDNAADIAGKGTGVSGGSINFNAGAKYGLIMCIYHCLPMLDYTTDFVDTAFTKINAADYAIPEFDRVGMQAVPLIHMMNPLASEIKVSNPESLILGYAPRYIDYKTSFDVSVGAFKDTLKNWVISYGNQSLINQLGYEDPTGSPVPSLGDVNYTMFKVNPNSLNPLFAVAVNSELSTDQFLCSSFFDVKVVRNLDTDGLPY